MKQLISYDPGLVCDSNNFHLPGIERFAGYFKMYNGKVTPVDRTGTIRIPVRTASLFPMPKFRIFTRTLEDVCDARAKELLKRADELNLPIYVLYSGGIDSSLALISLLKHATLKQRANITVLMSEDSITEHPRLYQDHIYGKLSVDSSISFAHMLGANLLMITGEHNDQLNGSDAVGYIIQAFGPRVIHEPYSRSLLFSFFGSKLANDSLTDFYLSLFEKLVSAAQVEIRTNFDFLWWINFSLKWQNVSTRILPLVHEGSTPSITKDYFLNNVVPFFRTEDFELWSMNNPDKKIKDTWTTYKWACKDIIYKFTGDAEYRDHKAKSGSLSSLFLQQHPYAFIDDSFKFYRDLDVNEYYNPNNDFAV